MGDMETLQPAPLSGNQLKEAGEGVGRRESRGIEVYSPIIYWIGWIAILYFVLYIIAVYIGPTIFGTRPYYPFYYGRSLRTRRHAHESEMTKLTGNILSSIDKRQ